MKFKLFLYILLSAVLLAACHKPVVAQSNNRIMLTQLERGPSIGGSRKGLVGVTNSNGDQRYTFYVNVADTCINWIVYPTGNTTMIDAFVQRCGSDSIWYIDNDGRSMLLAPYGGGGGGDYDWLEIGNNQIPDNINDSIYTYKYAAVGARLVWPTAEFLVNDSVGAALAVIQGSRNARLALYDKNNSTWSMIDHGGSTDLWYTGSGGEVIWKTTAGTPQAPTIPQVKHFRIGLADSTIQMHQYPSTRVDTATITNFLYTDPQGIVRSRPVGDIPGGVSEPASQVVYGTGTGVDSDPRILATPGSSGFQLQVKATAGQGVSVDSTTGAYGVYTSSSGRGSSSWTGLMADRLDGSGTASSTVYNRGTGAAQFYAYSAASQPRSVYDNGTYQVSIGIDSTGLKISNASTLGSYPNYGLTQKNNYVGIKTTNPLDPLHVNGAARISGAIKDNSGSAGSSGQVLTSTGTGWNWAAAPATSPAGSNQQIQFNNSGAFGASSSFTWNGSTLSITAGSETPIELKNPGATSKLYFMVGSGGNLPAGDAGIYLGSNANNTYQFMQFSGTGSSKLTRFNSGFVILPPSGTTADLIGYYGGGATAYTSIRIGPYTSNNGAYTCTSGTQTDVIIGGSNNQIFQPTSGNAIYNLLKVVPNINQTGTASGRINGIFISPTLTSVTGSYASFSTDVNSQYAYYQNGTSAKNIFAGATQIGSSSDPGASAVLQVTSTTKGFLPPTQTTTERNAISSPANGLEVYNTTTSRPNVYASSAWKEVAYTSDFADGTYKPTLTNVANVDSSSAYTCQYMQVGSTVTVSGKINIDPTTSLATATQVGFTVPVASNFTTAYNAAGTVYSADGQQAAIIRSDATNDRAEVYFLSGINTVQQFYFTFTYRVQ